MNNSNLFEQALASSYRVGIYCRLSKDDEDRDGDSASIQHQREMLLDYCKERGWEVTKIYQDDGFSGLNQRRPDLQRLLDDVKSKKINLVITKDFSRLGRNHLETGNLLEDYFPRYGCRYIAINDAIDTMYDNNEMAPFKGIMNEMYSRDISKKVHSSYAMQAKLGIYTGTVAPFGYLKDLDKKGHLIIDEETAPFMRFIFEWAKAGKGANYIQRRLEEMKVPCPAWWSRTRGFRNQVTRWEVQDPENGRFVWDTSIINDMLKNPVYYGAIASQKKNYKFKVGTISNKDAKDWIIVKNMHEGIIDKATFDTVQKKVHRRKHMNNKGEYSLFAGLLICADCGKTLTIRRQNQKKDFFIYSCVTYNKYGKHHCRQHRVEYDKLYDYVLKEIRKLAKEALGDERDAACNLMDRTANEQKAQNESCIRTITKAKNRISILEKMLSKVYEDLASGRINESTFNTIVDNNQKEQEELRATIEEAETLLTEGTESSENAERWIKLIRQYANVKKLDREMLNILINKIVVYETEDKYTRDIRLEIHYNLKPADIATSHILTRKEII